MSCRLPINREVLSHTVMAYVNVFVIMELKRKIINVKHKMNTLRYFITLRYLLRISENKMLTSVINAATEVATMQKTYMWRNCR